MTREEKAAKMLMLFNINDIGEGELNTWYSGIDKDMQEALNIAIEVLQGQSAYCEECREAMNDMLRKMQEKIKELKDTKESDLINRQDAIDVVNYEVYDGYDAIVNGIKALPSVVSEYKTFCGVPIEEAVRIMQEYNAKPKTNMKSWDGLYIKVYADDDPQDKAEKMYQICGDIAELSEVVEFLKEYCDIPSAEPCREDREEYELATEQVEHDAMYESTYNSEDGSM